ncbi:MAG: type II secretion system secretin GspD [Proteobacteria bacterium]|nr:type II secretion system secretin GspD [Pseudomonadota bacterium]
MRRGEAPSGSWARRIGLGFAGTLLVALLAGCETVSLDQPSEVAPEVAARSDEPSTAPEAQAVEAPAPAGALDDLSPLSSNAGALVAPEIYRGTGVLARRPARRASDIAIESDGRVTLNFANADIREVVDVVLGETLGVSYIIDPKVQGQVTARTSRPIPRAAVIPALENILAMNGAALTLDDGIYKVVTLQQAATSLTTPVVAPTRADLARGFAIHVIPLRFAAAQAMADILKPFVGPGRVLRVDAARNLLIFAGTGTEAADLLDMVTVFDVDWMAGMSFALFPVQVADAKSLVADLETVFLEGDSPLVGVVRFVPIERLNAVLVISSQPAYLERAETWIDRLDRGAEGTGRRIFVYHVQNSRAADLAEVLTRIFETEISERRRAAPELAPGLSPVSIAPSEPAPRRAQAAADQGQAGAPQAGAPQSGVPPTPVETVSAARPAGGRRNDLGSIATIQESGNIRIIADEKNNALVILATSAEYRMIEATLKRLDITPLQVLIEVTIAEVTLDDDLKYGLQWFFEQGDSSITFSTLSTGAVASAFPGFSYFFNGNDARVVLNALTKITDVRVISSPQLMVLDNQSARLQVGDQVPIATQSAVSITDPDAPIVNTIQFRDTGVILEVTPRVNASGLVVLDVFQEVSDVISTTTSAIDSPTIQQRSIQSTVAVQSGDTIALGGLIRDREEDAVSGIPILSSIPILGNLFKTTQKIVRRTELLVLITPRVVRDRREALDVTQELRRRLSTLGPLEKRIEAPE